MIETANYRLTYTGNDANTEFEYKWPITSASEVLITHIDADGVESEWVDGVDCTVHGVGSNTEADWYIASTDPLPSGQRLVLTPNFELTQETDFGRRPFDPDTHETAFDKLTLLIQQLQEEIDRCVKLEVGSDDTTTEVLTNLSEIQRDCAASETAAATSETNAATSATAASASATSASGSATAAAASATSASGSATTSATQAGNASTLATAAGNSATAAAASETAASGSASSASTSATAAAGSASEASDSADAAAASAASVNIEAGPVAGDMLYYDGNQWKRLAKGTAGQKLQINSGATAPEWATSGGFTSPLTTKGDTHVFGASDDRLPIGTDGQILTAASSETLGMKWDDVPTELPSSPSQGDIIYYDGSAWTKLAKGTAGQKLQINSGATAPEWATESSGTSFIHFAHKVANTTNGIVENLSSSWATCSINTEVADPASLASVSSNVITLAAGTYRFRVHTVVTQTSAYVSLRLRKTNGTAATLGVGGGHLQGPTSFEGRFTLTESSTIELQQISPGGSGGYTYWNGGNTGEDIYIRHVVFEKE
ncbi:MAG: hypothetical protein PHV34_05865 [Verrucomicrobiae bacterium]|nr:hypothetical protein [Verrucomicrobiae bacterium]